MFKLKNKNLYISRTESGKVIIKRKDSSKISELDIKELRIYNKDALDEAPIVIIQGKYLDSEDKTTIYFDLGEFTNLDANTIEYSNEPVEYWYEIRISDNIVVGYDDAKAKSLFLYPAGIDKK